MNVLRSLSNVPPAILLPIVAIGVIVAGSLLPKSETSVPIAALLTGDGAETPSQVTARNYPATIIYLKDDLRAILSTDSNREESVASYNALACQSAGAAQTKQFANEHQIRPQHPLSMLLRLTERRSKFVNALAAVDSGQSGPGGELSARRLRSDGLPAVQYSEQ